MLFAVLILAQASGSGTSLPASCATGDRFVLDSGGVKNWYCNATNSWRPAAAPDTNYGDSTRFLRGDWSWQVPSSGGLPSGLIVMTLTSCPAGFSEVASLSGKFVLGTVAANGNVGTTGGSDNITPAGTNSAPAFTGNAWSAPAVSWPAGVPTHSGTAASFSGNALGTHAHELPWQIPTTTTIRQIAAGTFGTGTSRAATAVSAAGTANTTSAAVALSQAVSAGTPAGTVTITNQGTVAWPAGVPTLGAYTPTGSVAAPTFTGTQTDNRPAFTRVIFCQSQ